MNSLFNLIQGPNIYKNSHKSLLIERSIQNKEGLLGPNGELVVLSGAHTGRAAKDKYIVVNEITNKKIWWENNINKMTQEVFNELTLDVVNYLNNQKELFFTERSVGLSSQYSLGIEFISTRSSAAMFTQYMFKPFIEGAHNDHYKILHAPSFEINSKKYGTRSETVIVTCFKEKLTIIVGTSYAGEIKKSVFSTMNFLLPDVGILPLHSGANQNFNEESFVFLGLSGTGKTTLATDEGYKLIGDDEHGISKKGIFNFEGGCYAKTFKLSNEIEPIIYKASTQYSSLLENVELSSDRNSINFSSDSISENGRSSYPLSFIVNKVDDGVGKIPKNIFYLSADAFGVLPPVSFLSEDQAIDFFLLGYTAKLAGTEVGVKTPVATFSTCFGAPFMLHHPEVYSSLLKDLIEKYNIKIWLINTGWYGGSYGVGSRFPIKVTRNIIRSIQSETFDKIEFNIDSVFKLKIPKKLNLVDSKILDPRNAWENQESYLKIAKSLSNDFTDQLKKIKKNKNLLNDLDDSTSL